MCRHRGLKWDIWQDTRVIIVAWHRDGVWAFMDLMLHLRNKASMYLMGLSKESSFLGCCQEPAEGRLGDTLTNMDTLSKSDSHSRKQYVSFEMMRTGSHAQRRGDVGPYRNALLPPFSHLKYLNMLPNNTSTIQRNHTWE
jgi:hypothetical protein